MDLTGFWTGTYWYFVHGQPVVSFIANIDDVNGRLSGSISEPDSFTGATSRLEAFILGEREGSSVKFAKVYDGAGPFAHRVEYSGSLSTDGKTVRGSWYLAGEWGGFAMSRQLLEAEEMLEDQIAEPAILEVKSR